MISSLVIKYKRTECDYTFSEIYRIASANWDRELISLSNKYKLDRHDVESIANEKLIEVVKSFKGTNDNEFTRFLRSALKKGCIDEVRRVKNRLSKESPLTTYEKTVNSGIDDEDNENTIIDIAQFKATNANIVEDVAIENIQKSHDQRQLIVALTKFADNMTRQSLSAFSQTDSYRKAGELIGISDKTVKKNIRKLSRNYDANRFGDIHEYFTVPTLTV